MHAPGREAGPPVAHPGRRKIEMGPLMVQWLPAIASLQPDQGLCPLHLRCSLTAPNAASRASIAKPLRQWMWMGVGGRARICGDLRQCAIVVS